MPKKKPIDPNCIRRQSSRKVRAPQKFDAAPVKREHGYNYWSLMQKQGLLKALTQFSERELHTRSLTQKHFKTLHRHIKTKSVDSIKSYIESLIRSIPKEEDANVNDDAPIQQWVELAEDQAEATGLDCSSDIAKMLSTASKESHGVFSASPDFKSLYKFLDALFQGRNLPELSNIDSLVILDCIDNLASFMDDVDTTEQKDFMINQSEKLRAFFYSKKDFNVATEMCDEIANGDPTQNDQSEQSSQHDQPIASTSGTDINSAESVENRITLSMSSINPFGVPATVLNFKKDATDV